MDEYAFDAELHARLIEILREAWVNLDASNLINYISDDFQYDSQWVFASLDSKGYKEYIVGKFNAIRKTGSKIIVRVVNDTYYRGEMLELSQDVNQPSFLRIKCADGKIFKMDMCAF